MAAETIPIALTLIMIADWIIPDPIPLVDEIALTIATGTAWIAYLGHMLDALSKPALYTLITLIALFILRKARRR